jgi:hypothetical protein
VNHSGIWHQTSLLRLAWPHYVYMKTHDYCSYDFEVDCRESVSKNAKQIINAWHQRKHPSAFEQMYQAKFGLASSKLSS